MTIVSRLQQVGHFVHDDVLETCTRLLGQVAARELAVMVRLNGERRENPPMMLNVY
jgi:hypothetical protein